MLNPITSSLSENSVLRLQRFGFWTPVEYTGLPKPRLRPFSSFSSMCSWQTHRLGDVTASVTFTPVGIGEQLNGRPIPEGSRRGGRASFYRHMRRLKSGKAPTENALRFARYLGGHIICTIMVKVDGVSCCALAEQPRGRRTT